MNKFFEGLLCSLGFHNWASDKDSIKKERFKITTGYPKNGGSIIFITDFETRDTIEMTCSRCHDSAIFSLNPKKGWQFYRWIVKSRKTEVSLNKDFTMWLKKNPAMDV